MAEQECTDGAVADEENIAGQISAQDFFDLVQDAPLCMDRTFPAPNTDERAPEKLIGYRLELLGLKESCRRTIVLVHGLAYLQRNVQTVRNDLGCLDCLPLSACDDLRRPPKLSGIRKCHRTRSANRAQAPGWDRDRRVNGDLRVSKIANDAGHASNDEALRAARQLALMLLLACGRHFVENGGFDPLQFGNVHIELDQPLLGSAHLRLALGKLGRPPRLPILVLIGIGARQNGRAGPGLLKALAKGGFFSLGRVESLTRGAPDRGKTLPIGLAVARGGSKV